MKKTNLVVLALAVSSLLFAARSAHASELTLYFIHSPLALKWSKPGALVRSTIWNTLDDMTLHTGHSIGHVYEELNCDATAGAEARHVYSAMTNTDDSEETDVLFKEKQGLGILFYNFKGRLESGTEVTSDIDARLANGKIRYVTYKINSSTCQRLLTYLDEYHARGYDKWYGLPNRPLYGEGGGCSAFGVSFLEVAGLLSPEYATVWSRNIRVPKKDVGGPLTGNQVDVWGLFFSMFSRWAHPDEDGYDLFFWEPNLMHRWVGKVWDDSNGLPIDGFVPEKKGKALGLAIDQTMIPTPTGPIWKVD